jgi:hypothetical protein
MRRALILLALGSLLALGCRGRTPVYVAADDITTAYSLDQVELLGPTEGQSSRIRVFGLSFGEPKSFMRAQTEALEKVGGELLFDTVRYDGSRGIVLPFGTLLSLVIPDIGITDVPVVVQEIWYVQGMAARYIGKRAPLPTD